MTAIHMHGICVEYRAQQLLCGDRDRQRLSVEAVDAGKSAATHVTVSVWSIIWCVANMEVTPSMPRLQYAYALVIGHYTSIQRFVIDLD